MNVVQAVKSRTLLSGLLSGLTGDCGNGTQHGQDCLQATAESEHPANPSLSPARNPRFTSRKPSYTLTLMPIFGPMVWDTTSKEVNGSDDRFRTVYILQQIKACDTIHPLEVRIETSAHDRQIDGRKWKCLTGSQTTASLQAHPLSFFPPLHGPSLL